MNMQTGKIYNFALQSIFILFLFLPNGYLFAIDLDDQKQAAELNQKGIESLDKKEYKLALDYFEQANKLIPDNQIIKKNLAIAYNNYGTALAKQNAIEDAKEYLYKAIEFNENDIHIKENLCNVISSSAAEFYKNGNYEVALMQSKESLSLIPKHVPSLILLGQVYYQMQELGKAEETWNKAYALDPRNPDLKQMLTRLKNEKKVETKLKQLDTSYFDIRFDKDVIEPEIYDIKSYLQDAYREVGRDFNYYPYNKLPVILYTEEDFQKLRQTPDWVAGIYDGKIRLPVKRQGIPAEEFKPLLLHEYTHAIVFYLTDGKCPVWFTEGLAKYEETKDQDVDVTPVINALSNNSFIPLNKLNSSFSLYSDPQKLNLAYLEAYLFIKFVLDRWNFYMIKSILNEIKHDKSIEKAFYEQTGRSFEKLDNEWREYIQRNYCK